MKPEYELIKGEPENSFTSRFISRNSRPLLSQAWHYHPEIEICFSMKSHGKRFVGNNISNYAENDLVLLGSNLPHGFTTEMACEQIVIQLNTDFLGQEFFNKPELSLIKKVIKDSNRGIEYHNITKIKAGKLINKVLNKSGLKKMIYLLELLDLLSKAKDATPICSKEYSMDLNTTHLKRIKLVYNYIMDNYMHEIRTKELADLINMTEAGFYKFIKKHTKKTLNQIVNEFRINHASRLLMSTDKTVSQISFESGFNNISYFNRKFKEIIDKTPLNYRASINSVNN